MNPPTVRPRSLKTKLLRRVARYAAHAARWCERQYRRNELADGNLRRASPVTTHMTEAELDALHTLASHAVRTHRVLEIGSYLGASSRHMAAALALHGGHLYCVDTWANETMPEGERDTFAEFCANLRPVSAFVTTLRKRSDELTPADVPLPVDLVFIDADHSYAAVQGDFRKVSGWVDEGGTIAFHDASWFEAVARVVGEALASGEWVLEGKVDSLVWIRKVAVFPNPMTPEERQGLK